MKISILNVKYSPNLGDGVIAECIEYQLKKLLPDSEVYSIDIGGMDDYGSGGSILGHNLSLMSKLKKLPRIIQEPIFEIINPILLHYKYAKRWNKKLSTSDLIVIGGGHLLMDVDQYFPMRIRLAVLQAKENIPIAIYSVGVSQKMTSAGQRMFEEAFSYGSLFYLSVRDEKSKNNWSDVFKIPQIPDINRDPGLLASETYGYGSFNTKKLNDQKKVIAFGVSDPASMRPHSDSKEGVVCSEIDFYLKSIHSLGHKFQILMFTNGEDYEYLSKVQAAIEKLPDEIKSNVSVLPRARRPSELINQIVNADLLIAHRLHANIIAYSHGIPSIGLGWDSKLKSFFSSVNRDEFVITSNNEALTNLNHLVNRALVEGIDKRMHQKVLSDAKEGLINLCDAFLNYRK